MSRLAKQDQRKVYLDWANHYLKKGGYSDTITDLKDIADGQFLPKVIHAVVMEEVPNLCSTPSGDDERRENVDCCIKFLQSCGVNCGSVSAKDLCDGNMKAILSLFYSLSQFKKASIKSAAVPASPLSPPAQANTVNPKEAVPKERATSPKEAVSSSKEAIVAVRETTPTSRDSAVAPKEREPEPENNINPHPSRICRPVSPGLRSSHGISAGLAGGNKSIPSIRKHAGSSIQTSTSFDPGRQRKIPQKPLASDSAGALSDDKLETPVPLTPSANPAPLVEAHVVLNEAQPSTQADMAMEAPPDSPALLPISAPSKASPQISRSPLCKEDAPGDQPQDPQSRLRFPGGGATMTKNSPLVPPSVLPGRSTPSLGRSESLLIKGTSGLVRPSSRLSKQGQHRRSLDDLDADDEDNGVEKVGSPIPLTRKGSDGAIKKHKVVGTASLPRQLSRAVPDYSAFSSPAGGNSGLASSSESEVAPPGEQDCLSPNPGRAEDRAKLDQATKRVLKAPSKIGGGGLSVPGKVQVEEKPSLAVERSGEEVVEDEEEGSGGGRRMTASLEETRPSSRLQMLKPGAVGRNPSLPRLGKDTRLLMATMAIPTPTTAHVSESVTGSNSSLDSYTGSVDIQAAESGKLDACTTTTTTESYTKTSPLQRKGLPAPSTITKATASNLAFTPVIPTKDTTTGNDMDKEVGSPVATPSPRCNRRISPEGMSHEEAQSPSEVTAPTERDQTSSSEKERRSDLIGENDCSVERKAVSASDSKKGSHVSATLDTKTAQDNSTTADPCAQSKPPLPPSQGANASPLVPPGASDAAAVPPAVKPADVPTVVANGNLPTTSAHIPCIDQLSSSGSMAPKRARSLSPTRPPRGDDFGEPSSLSIADGVEQRSLSTSSSGSIGGDSTKSDVMLTPLVAKLPLRSSLKSSTKRNMVNGSDSSLEKRVTISPRESQIEYMSDHPIVALGHTSQLLSVTVQSSSPPEGGVVRSPGVVRRATARGEGSSLRPKLQQSEQEKLASESTPQLLETYEAQLARMHQDLDDKARMLNMYENNMADLSLKMHSLKRTLEEKDAEIRLLNNERQRWDISLEARSLASRAASDAGGLSDGCLSDGGEGEEGEKEVKKKKKPWKQRFSFRKKKDTLEVPASVEVESIVSTQTNSKGSKNKKKPLDLTSISELSPLEQKLPLFKELDARSMFTLNGPDMSSDCVPTIEQPVTVYEDRNPGTPAQVILQVGCSDEEAELEDIILGSLNLAPTLTWVAMDTKITEIFVHHMNCIDPDGYLKLSEDSVLHYYISEQRRELGNALLPPQTPHQSLGSRANIRVVLKGASQEACDSLAYKTLVSVLTLQAYMAMLNDTRWLVVMGTKGTCKTSIASGLAEHLALGLTGSHNSDTIVRFSLGKDGLDVVLHYMKNDLAKNTQHRLYPPIILLDEVYDCGVLEQVMGVASSLNKRPFIICTLCSGTTRGIPLHQLLLHHQVRVITCNPQQEPVVGILSRSLRKRVFYLKAHSQTIDLAADRMLSWLPYLLEHLNSFINKFHSNNVALGPRVFMGCPVDQSGPDVEVWFINLWNHFIIPYLMGTIMAGIETYSADPCLDWIDVREWVVETYPWQPSVNVNRLRTLNPDDVGWNHAIRPQHGRMRYLNDPTRLDDDTRSLIRMS